MSRILGRLDRFWFAEAPAARLAVLRILVGSYAVWLLLFRYDAILETTQLPASQFQPVGVTSFLSAPPPPHVIHASLVLAIVVGVPFILGLAYRVTGPLFAGLLLFVLTHFASWGSVNHPDALVTAHLFVLGLTRAADAVSLDALIRTWRGRAGRRPPSARPDPAGAWQYGFPLKLICAVTATSYLLAGIAKMSGSSGWAWMTGESLLRQVAWDGLRKELLGSPPPAFAASIYEHVWVFMLLALGSLVVELGAPLALLDRRIAYPWVLAVFSMHWGIYFIMGITFRYYMWGVAFASFFPLERVLPAFRWIGVAAASRAASLRGRRAPVPVAPSARAWGSEPAPDGIRAHPAYSPRPADGRRGVEGTPGIVAGLREDAAQPALCRTMLLAALVLFAAGIAWAVADTAETAYSWPAAILIVLGGLCATISFTFDDPSFASRSDG